MAEAGGNSTHRPVIESVNGIILRTRPLTETSLIVNWLTADLGRVATVAKGARRPKSPFAGKLDFAYVADFTFHRSRRSDLHTLREVSLRETHPQLRRDLPALQQAARAVACIELATETDTPLPEVHALFCAWLAWLAGTTPDAKSLLGFEFKLLSALGFQPDLAASSLNPGARQLAVCLRDDAWPALAPLRLSPAQANDLHQFLDRLLLEHFGRLPRALSRLDAI
jgi:DNA repair protein RecO (recombination protein O)